MRKLARKLAFLHERHLWSFHLLAAQVFGGELITRFLGSPRGTGALAVLFSIVIQALWLRWQAPLCDPDHCPFSEKSNERNALGRTGPGSVP